MKKKHKNESAADRKKRLKYRNQQRRIAQSKQEREELTALIQRQWEAFIAGKQSTSLNGVSLSKYMEIAGKAHALESEPIEIERDTFGLLK